MNIIEYVWDYLKRRVRKREIQPRNADELWLILEEEWYKLPIKLLKNLYNSMPRRIQTLKHAKGGYTGY